MINVMAAMFLASLKIERFNYRLVLILIYRILTMEEKTKGIFLVL